MATNESAPRHIRPVRQTSCTTTNVRSAFVVVVMVVLAAPLVLMPFARSDATSEKRELAPAPRLVTEEGANLRFLEDAGAYFQDHFAFRTQLVDLDATIRQRLFLTSATPNVVVGTEGWLYYAGEMGDYQHMGVMSEAAVQNAAKNLSLVQEYFEGLGKRFALVVAPNKSTACPGHVPYYRVRAENASNLERLLFELRRRGVNVVDVGDLLSGREDLYFSRDSHWNDAGALVVYEAILKGLGRPSAGIGSVDLVTDAHVGDLDAMLHPASASPELQQRAGDADEFAYLGEASSVEDSYVATRSMRTGAEGSLLMYRDSFANNLVPPFASTYAQAAFTKNVPYNMGAAQVSFAEDVVVERAERHLAFFSTDPPYLPAPVREIASETAAQQSSTTVFATRGDSYLVVEGTLDESLGQTDVFVQLVFEDGGSRTHACFSVSEPSSSEPDFEGQAGEEADGHIHGDMGYRAYVDASGEEMGHLRRIRVLAGTTSEAREVAGISVQSI